VSPRIVGVGGSLRTGSTTLAALRVALEGASRAGGDVELLDVRTLDLPPYDGSAHQSAGLARFEEVTAAADGMIWASPLYHGTISGAFKNALDWLQLLASHEPPFLTGTPVGLIATAAGVQGLQAINTMEYVVRALRGWTVPFVVPVARSYQAFTDDGAPLDSGLDTQLAKLGQEVVAAARKFAA